jgi:hypothetical protein
MISDHAIVLFVLSFIFVIACGHFEWKRICLYIISALEIQIVRFIDIGVICWPSLFKFSFHNMYIKINKW